MARNDETEGYCYPTLGDRIFKAKDDTERKISEAQGVLTVLKDLERVYRTVNKLHVPDLEELLSASIEEILQRVT